MTRTKVKKFIKIRWDISYRMKFRCKSEDEQIWEVMEASWHLSALQEECRQVQAIREMVNISLTTST